MGSIKVIISEEGEKLMQAAADYEELPISSWLRTVGLKEARAAAHRKMCATPKEQQYKINGTPCTKEEWEAQEERLLAAKAQDLRWKK